MNKLALPHSLDHMHPYRPLRTPGKGLRKKFPRFKPRNPLKSIDSNERIQGNPRKSNLRDQGSSNRNGQGPRKPKRIDRTEVAAPAAKEPNRLHPKAKRLGQDYVGNLTYCLKIRKYYSYLCKWIAHKY
jgi:hypothetical protein